LSTFVEKVRELIHAGDVRISENGYDELAEDKLSAKGVLDGVLRGSLSRNIQIFQKGHAPCFCRKTVWECRYMLYGAFQKVMISPWCWLRPIDLIRQDGMKRLRGGVNDETA
jgi:hypothetical protein